MKFFKKNETGFLFFKMLITRMSSLAEVHLAVQASLRHRAEVVAGRENGGIVSMPTPADFVRAVLEGRCNDALSAGLDLDLELDELHVDGVPLIVAEIHEGHDLMAAVLMELGGYFVTPDGWNFVVEAAGAGLWGLVDYWLLSCPNLLDLVEVAEALHGRNGHFSN